MRFRLKIVMSTLGLLSVLFAVGGCLLISISFSSSLEGERQSAFTSYRMALGTLQIVSGLNGGLSDETAKSTIEQLSDLKSGTWQAVRLYTADREIYSLSPELIAEPSSPAEAGVCRAEYDGEASRLTLYGSFDAGNERVFLDMSRDVSRIIEVRRQQVSIYRWVFAFMALLCAVMSYTIAGLLTRPLGRLSRAARKISRGELSARAGFSSDDEIGALAENFDAMAGTLETNIHELEEAVSRQERFVADFAHEMKTPMTSIIGYADLIRGGSLSRDEELRAAEYIFSEGRRLANLSSKLLDLTVLRRGEGKLVAASPSSLILSLAESLTPHYAKQGVRLTCRCEKGRCMLDPDLVKSLVVNLADNARKALEGKGGDIEIGCRMTDGGCVITVTDNGRGIPPDAIQHLTEAFYRVDRSRARRQGGVGLGLSLCNEITALHGGSLSFKSREGIGTIVRAELKGGRA